MQHGNAHARTIAQGAADLTSDPIPVTSHAA
jgi:hypothetical protein